MEIRRAMLNDIEQLRQLNYEFWVYNARLQPEYYKEAKESGAYPKSVITNDDSDIIIATESDTVMGLIHVIKSKTPPYAPIVQHEYAEVVDLIVSAPYRRKGIGTKLMDAAKEWGKARNLDYIELFVLSDAKGEIAFYEDYGFDTVSHTMRFGLEGNQSAYE